MSWFNDSGRNRSYTAMQEATRAAYVDGPFGQPLVGARPVEFPYHSGPVFEQVPPWACPVEIFLRRAPY
jgi:hypothetical protein